MKFKVEIVMEINEEGSRSKPRDFCDRLITRAFAVAADHSDMIRYFVSGWHISQITEIPDDQNPA